METQIQDRWLGLDDSIWGKWTRNKANVKILIWVILLRWLYLSDKLWNNCPQKVVATSTPLMEWRYHGTSGTKGKNTHYYYSYHSLVALKPVSRSYYLWRWTDAHYFQAGSGTNMVLHQWRQSICSRAKQVLQISLRSNVKGCLPVRKKKSLLTTFQCICKETSPAFYDSNYDYPPFHHQQIFCAADIPSNSVPEINIHVPGEL